MKYNALNASSTEVKRLRTNCLQLLRELEKWGIRPFRKDRRSIVNQIKFTYNVARLNTIHQKLEDRLNRAMMSKLTQGLESGEQ